MDGQDYHGSLNSVSIRNSISLSSVRGSNNELSLTSSGGTQGIVAAVTVDFDIGLRVREDSGNLMALLALHIHEVGVWGLNQSLKFMQFFLDRWVDVKQIHFHCAMFRG